MAYTNLNVATAAPAQRSFTARHANALVFAGLLVVAVLLRGVSIGDPALGLDEDFYLLVGDRIWQGALPYVDIWDRKPVGLFLLYAALRPFSGDGVVAYQVAALLFATSTALVVVRIATRFVALSVAVVGGLVYLVYLPILGGGGGQSPVFYNLFVAGAALLIIRSGEAGPGASAFPQSLAAMLLVGIALQMKTSAAIEGAFFGLWLIVRLWRTEPDRHLWLLRAAALFLAAMTPLALAMSFYVAKGHGAAFVFANFQAAVMKHEPTGVSELGYLKVGAVEAGPLLAVALLAAARLMTRRPRADAAAFLVLWCGAAICEFFAIGHYYDHYALPALVPLCVFCATLAEPAAIRVAMLFLFMFWNVGTTGFPNLAEIDGHKVKMAAYVAALDPYARFGCIYINAGSPMAYLLTHSCLATPFAFPEHLSNASEAKASGGPQAMVALVARRPSAIVIGDETFFVRHYPRRNHANDAILAAAIARSYRLAGVLADPGSDEHLRLYVRADLP